MTDIFIPVGKHGKGRNKYNNTEKRIIKYRNELKTTSQISRLCHYTKAQIEGILRAEFGVRREKDPLHLEIKRRFNAGDSVKSIARDLPSLPSTVASVLKKSGLEPEKTWREKIKAKVKKKPRDTPQFAMDLYCAYYKEGVTINQIAKIEGFGAGFVSHLMLKHVPEYVVESRNRREKSAWKRMECRRGKKTKLFASESEFLRYVFEKIKQIDPTAKMESHNNGSPMRIDIVTSTACIELKTVIRKKDIATAAGQLMLATAKSPKEKIICVPSDLTINATMVEALDNINVQVKTDEELTRIN